LFPQALMGVFFYVRSVALVEDLAIPEEAAKSTEKYLMAVDDGFNNVSSCFQVILASISAPCHLHRFRVLFRVR
jgi:hypothetical protein